MAEQAESAGPGPGWPRVCVAAIFLLVAALLVMCSFRLSYLLVRASRRKWCRQAATPSQAGATVTAVSRAARHYPGRAACLEQSLAAVLLARQAAGDLTGALARLLTLTGFMRGWR